jgi:hypothetical protein
MVCQQIALWCYALGNVITQREVGGAGSKTVSYENRNYYK